ncbi:MAG: type II toxin-antitoxin system HicB family antitoxin [bacterium]|nr:type II toxin-antitoxin system HicB family antitoxin [bacterium]
MVKLTQKNEQEIERLRGLFLSEIEVVVQRSEDGGFFAKILTLEGLFTEAETFSELIEMVNDAVMTYFEVPRQYVSYMPSYVPSLKVAQEFGVFPAFPQKKEITLPLAVNM